MPDRLICDKHNFKGVISVITKLMSFDLRGAVSVNRTSFTYSNHSLPRLAMNNYHLKAPKRHVLRAGVSWFQRSHSEDHHHLFLWPRCPVSMDKANSMKHQAINREQNSNLCKNSLANVPLPLRNILTSFSFKKGNLTDRDVWNGRRLQVVCNYVLSFEMKTIVTCLS